MLKMLRNADIISGPWKIIRESEIISGEEWQ